MGAGRWATSWPAQAARCCSSRKGRSTLPGTPGTIRSTMPELAEPLAGRSLEAYYDALARAGRSTDEIEDISGRFRRGGCCAVHRQRDGGVLGAVWHGLRAILRPRFHSPAELPRPWRFHGARIVAGQLRPDAALVRGGGEATRGSAASPIPCGRRRPGSVCPRRRPSPPTTNEPLVDYLTGRGLHPYHLPMACDYTDGCATCQSYLCDQACKNDACAQRRAAGRCRARRPPAGRMSGRAPGRGPLAGTSR